MRASHNELPNGSQFQIAECKVVYPELVEVRDVKVFCGYCTGAESEEFGDLYNRIDKGQLCCESLFLAAVLYTC